MDLIASLFLVVMVDTDDKRRTTDDRRQTMPGVWHKLPTGELIIQASQHYLDVSLVHLPLRIIQSCKKWLLILKKDF